MKKVNSYILRGVSFCLFAIFTITNPTVVNGQSTYSLETDHMSMEDLGALLERIGEEIQWKGQVTIGGNTYPVKGFGSIEMGVGTRRQGGGTSINFEISAAGREGVPTRGTTYISYDRGGMRITPTEFAEILAKVGTTLESKGVFAIDDHSVTLDGEAKIVQQLTTRTQQMGGGSYNDYKFDVVFGQNDFPMPQDEAEDIESMSPADRDRIKELAKKETTGADQKAVAELIASLSRDLQAGKVRLGDQDLPAGENIRCGFSHLIATDGKSHRIRVTLRFGEGPRQTRRTGLRYGEEFYEPTKKVGALLKRLGTEILEDETIQLGENTFRIGQKSSYEVKASNRGFSIELKYTEPPKEE
ncbi:hypothetical protein ACFL6U_28215 [Planctomycetota bacterium]